MQAMSIADLRRLVERADLLLQREYKALYSHWNKDKQGFHTSRETRATGNINITTTCFGLFALLRSSDLLDQFFGHNDKKAGPAALDGVVFTLGSTPWTSEKLPEYNIYTTPIVLSTLYHLLNDQAHGPSVTKVLDKVECNKQLRTGLEAIAKSVTENGAARYPPYEPNAYLGYGCFEAFRGEAIKRHFKEEPALSDRCATLMDQLARWGEAELHRLIAFHSAREMAMFDPIQLAYALRIYTEHYATTTKQLPSKQPLNNQPLNQKLVARAVEIIFEHQEEDGLWPKSRPIFHFAQLGSVYPFTFEMLDILIPNKPESSLFGPHIGKLEAALRWAENNYIDGEQEKGWRSSHVPYGSDPHGWSTAAVFLAVRKIRAVVVAQIRDNLLEDFRAQRNDAPDGSLLGPEKFYDAEVPRVKQSLKSVLQKHLIDPHNPGGSEADRRYSAVFYGPPGTAKTTTAMAVARALGWPYIYLQTSDFAGEGVNQVIGKARNIFDRLSLLEKAVILFDEVEEFVRDRKEGEPSSRMLTTSMLSLIQELQSKKGVIFIVATNFLNKFDAAITRTGGRFDMMLLIAPPSKEEKKRLFRERLAKRLPLEEAEKLYGAINKYVDDRFDKRLHLFAFTEWKLMVDAFIADIVKNNKCDEGSLDTILNDREVTIALSDEGLRKAYLESEKYVRL